MEKQFFKQNQTDGVLFNIKNEIHQKFSSIAIHLACFVKFINQFIVYLFLVIITRYSNDTLISLTSLAFDPP